MRVLATFTLGAVASLGMSACGSPPASDGVATAGGATQSVSAGPDGAYDEAKWIRCLREQGLTVDDPEPGREKPHIHDELVTSEKIRSATEACKVFNPVWGQPRQPRDPDWLAQYRKLAQCMRDHGIDMPDEPVPVAPPTAPGAAGRNPTGAVYEKALQECADQVPGVAETAFPGGKS